MAKRYAKTNEFSVKIMLEGEEGWINFRPLGIYLGVNGVSSEEWDVSAGRDDQDYSRGWGNQHFPSRWPQAKVEEYVRHRIAEGYYGMHVRLGESEAHDRRSCPHCAKEMGGW